MRETNDQLKLRMEKYKKPSQKRYCEWCGKELPEKSPSAMKYCDGECHKMGYAETNTRNQRSYRFRREMGWAKRT
jgi:hypothetical protein